MKAQIAARHFTLTDAIQEYVDTRLAQLDHLNTAETHAHVVLEHDESHGPKQYRLKAHLRARKDEFHAEAHSHDLYAGIDALAEKLDTQLRKAHGKAKPQHLDGRSAAIAEAAPE